MILNDFTDSLLSHEMFCKNLSWSCLCLLRSTGMNTQYMNQAVGGHYQTQTGVAMDMSAYHNNSNMPPVSYAVSAPPPQAPPPPQQQQPAYYQQPLL